MNGLTTRPSQPGRLGGTGYGSIGARRANESPKVRGYQNSPGWKMISSAAPAAPEPTSFDQLLPFPPPSIGGDIDWLFKKKGAAPKGFDTYSTWYWC